MPEGFGLEKTEGIGMGLICRQDAWDPFRDVAEIQEELNRVLNRPRAAQRAGLPEGGEWLPGVDIIEEKDRILVRARRRVRRRGAGSRRRRRRGADYWPRRQCRCGRSPPSAARP